MKKELEYQKFKGLIVFCNKCKRNIHNKHKGNKCDHPIDKQVYKAIVRIHGSGYTRKTKILKSRNFDKAIKEFLEYKEQVQNPILNIQPDKKLKSQYLKDTIEMYIDYLHDVDIPHHLKKHLSESYIYGKEIALKNFIRFLNNNGISIKTFKLSSINDKLVGKYCEYVENKSESNYTYNDKIKALRTFYNFLIDEEDYLIKNVWKKVKLKPEKPTDISISAEDFYDLLSVISPDDAIAQFGKTRRNMYRPWLKDVIRLKAYTGRRNAELFAMRWNMIYYEDDMPVYIASPNIKVNRKQNNFKAKDFEHAFVPVGEELLELLIDLGLDKNRNSYNYIIAPYDNKRNNLEKYSGRYFTFFFKKLKRNYTRQLKHLRQTYITREDLFINGHFSMQHSNYKTTLKHYSNRREVAKWMVENGFRIFPIKK